MPCTLLLVVGALLLYALSPRERARVTGPTAGEHARSAASDLPVEEERPRRPNGHRPLGLRSSPRVELASTGGRAGLAVLWLELPLDLSMAELEDGFQQFLEDRAARLRGELAPRPDAVR